MFFRQCVQFAFLGRKIVALDFDEELVTEEVEFGSDGLWLRAVEQED